MTIHDDGDGDDGAFSHEVQWAENCEGEVWSTGDVLLLMVFSRLAVRYYHHLMVLLNSCNGSSVYIQFPRHVVRSR